MPGLSRQKVCDTENNILVMMDDGIKHKESTLHSVLERDSDLFENIPSE